MDLGLTGKVAIVTGASRGIGAACALGLAREGARVAICAREAAQLERTATAIAAETGQRPFAQTADITDGGAVGEFFAAAMAALGEAEILVANSVGPPPGRFAQFEDAAWVAAFTAGALSVVRQVRAVLDGMRKCGEGAVVAIQSSSVKQPIPNLTLSNSIRPGVAGLFKSLATEYGADNVRFNVVCPGRIRTDRLMAVETNHLRAGESLEQRLMRMAEEIPLRRLGEAGEVADAVVYLTSQRARYVTGTVLQVDGGNLRGIF